MILERLDLELPRHNVQAQVVSKAMEVMGTVQLAMRLEPMHEQANTKFVEILKRGRFRWSLLVALITNHPLEVWTLLLEKVCGYVDGLLALADV